MSRISKYIATTLLCLPYAGNGIFSQGWLQKKVSTQVKNEKIKKILNDISGEAGFYFSYNSNLINEDSIVTISANNISVKQILGKLFAERFIYQETSSHIIITENTFITYYFITGYISNSKTGEKITDASVYDKQQLASAFTDENGFFRLRLKNKNNTTAITVSRVAFHDTAIQVTPGSDQEISASLNPENIELQPVVISLKIDNTWPGKHFVSLRQRKQSLNLRNFFASRAVQFSLFPGVSSQGKLNHQVNHIFSLNLLGGYTGGVNGLEIGGLFNINQKNMRYLQIAGALNVTGGSATGLQIAAAHNLVSDTLRGVQIAGYINKTEGLVKGVQVAGIYNYAKRLKGLQIGLINAADSTGGYSIGILNIVKGGYRRISVSTNNLANTNIAFRTGNSKLYSVVIGGMNISRNEKIYTAGFGLGRDFLIGKKISAGLEANYQIVKLTSWDNRLAQLKTSINYSLFKNLYLFSGINYNHYKNNDEPTIGNKIIVSHGEYLAAGAKQKKAVKNWIGWEAGITIETSHNQPLLKKKEERKLRLSVGINPGFAFDEPYQYAQGASIRLQKDFSNNISATITTGYTYFSVLKKYAEAGFYYNPYKTIPIKTGLKAFTGKHLYISGEAGWAAGLDKNKNCLVWSPAIGFEWDNGIDTGIKYEDYRNDGSSKQFALHLSYSFKL